MTSSPGNAVFISYRREVGGILAMALHQNLTERGVDAFYDIESLRAGRFDTVVLSQIAARPYFVLVLTPGTLERCADEGDWVRREIEHALETDRVIVPAYTPNFDFEDFDRFLPGGSGSEVGRFNGQELPQQWFTQAVERLVDRFLVPIEFAGADVSSADAADAERIQEHAGARDVVTDAQLSAQERFELAFGRAAAGDHEGAIADYTEAIRLDPENAWAFYNRGCARAETGDQDGAIADYTESIRLDPGNADPFQTRAVARAELRDQQGAIADYTEAIRLDAGDPRTYYNRGFARAAANDQDGAVADYTEAIRLEPGNAWAFYNRGFAREAMGDQEGAIADYTESIRLDPRNADPFHTRGIARAALGDQEGAIADYTEAISLQPEDAQAYYNRGVARVATGDLDGAVADLERSKSLAPNERTYAAMLRRALVLRKRS